VANSDQLSDGWGRFFAHWMAATLGYFLREFLPVLNTSINSPNSVGFDSNHWWRVWLFASLISLLGGGINSYLPCRPRELLKSLGFGFALDAAKLLLHQ
jgi:hypothetical protein